MSEQELVTIRQLRITADELRAAADVLYECAEAIEKEGADGVQHKTSTALRRVDEIAGWSKNIARKTDQQLAKIRRERDRLVAKRKKLD